MSDEAHSAGEARHGAIEQPTERALQRLRREAGFRSSIDMAKAIGVDAGRYNSIERSQWVPSDVAEKVADCLESRGVAIPSWLRKAETERDNVVCAIEWTRDDFLAAINRHAGTSLERGVPFVEKAIDTAVAEVRKQLKDRSIEYGWSVIDTLLPEDVLENARGLSLPKRERPGVEDNDEPRADFEYRSHVIRALEQAGWSIVLNDQGDIAMLSTTFDQTQTTFSIALDMRGRDMGAPGDWVRAACDARDTPPLRGTCGPDPDIGQTYFEARVFRDSWQRALPQLVLDAVRGVVPRGHNDNLVRDWYTRMFPDDALGARINAELTFDQALGAVSLGGGFYDALGTGDSIVRERVFHELSDRNGIAYEDIYNSWLAREPVCLAGGSQHSNEPLEAQGAAADAARNEALENYASHNIEQDAR